MAIKLASDRLKRGIKSLRNAYRDPWPRNSTLQVNDVERLDDGFRFHFEACNRRFAIPVSFSENLRESIAAADMEAIRPTLTSIAIAFAPFFFKLTDFGQVVLNDLPLDPSSSRFYERFLKGGLAEFRYLQGLNPTRDIAVTAKNESVFPPVSLVNTDRILALNGGGKDTIVAGELLRRSGLGYSWLSIRPTTAQRDVVRLSGASTAYEAYYQLDPDIDRYKAYPWGHVPHTSLVLAVGTLVAQLKGYKYVCAGNESSSNYGNVIFKGQELNHQYSKSFAYEEGFARYVNSRISGDIKVFSILRPFNDLQLARMFSFFEQYHGSFISCNRGISRGQWCKSCPKCAFTALALAPFIGANGILRVFGEDVFQRQLIRKHIQNLMTSPVKPWECVGTQEESALATSLWLCENPAREFVDVPRRVQLEASVATFDIDELKRVHLDQANPEHLIPEEIVRLLNPVVKSLYSPAIP